MLSERTQENGILCACYPNVHKKMGFFVHVVGLLVAFVVFKAPVV